MKDDSRDCRLSIFIGKKNLDIEFTVKIVRRQSFLFRYNTNVYIIAGYEHTQCWILLTKGDRRVEAIHVLLSEI
jgi:hypothetical protein